MHPEHPALRSALQMPGGALPPLLDADAIVALRALDDGGDGFLAELVGVFHAEAPARLQAIQQAARSRAPREVVALVHALRGSAQTLGLLRLADLCQQVERAGGDGRVADPVTLQRLEAEVAAATRALAGLGPFGAG